MALCYDIQGYKKSVIDANRRNHPALKICPREDNDYQINGYVYAAHYYAERAKKCLKRLNELGKPKEAIVGWYKIDAETGIPLKLNEIDNPKGVFVFWHRINARTDIPLKLDEIGVPEEAVIGLYKIDAESDIPLIPVISCEEARWLSSELAGIKDKLQCEAPARTREVTTRGPIRLKVTQEPRSVRDSWRPCCSDTGNVCYYVATQLPDRQALLNQWQRAVGLLADRLADLECLGQHEEYAIGDRVITASSTKDLPCPQDSSNEDIEAYVELLEEIRYELSHKVMWLRRRYSGWNPEAIRALRRDIEVENAKNHRLKLLEMYDGTVRWIKNNLAMLERFGEHESVTVRGGVITPSSVVAPTFLPSDPIELIEVSVRDLERVNDVLRSKVMAYTRAQSPVWQQRLARQRTQKYSDAVRRIICGLGVLGALDISRDVTILGQPITAGSRVEDFPLPPDIASEKAIELTKKIESMCDQNADAVDAYIYRMGLGPALLALTRSQPNQRLVRIKEAIEDPEKPWKLGRYPWEICWYLIQSIKNASSYYATPLSGVENEKKQLALAEFEAALDTTFPLLRISAKLRAPRTNRYPWGDIDASTVTENTKASHLMLGREWLIEELRAATERVRSAADNIVAGIQEEILAHGMGDLLMDATGLPPPNNLQNIRGMMLQILLAAAVPCLARTAKMKCAEEAMWYLTHDILQVTSRREVAGLQEIPAVRLEAKIALQSSITTMLYLLDVVHKLGRTTIIDLPWTDIKSHADIAKANPTYFMPQGEPLTSEYKAAMVLTIRERRALTDLIWRTVAGLGLAPSLEEITGLPQLERQADEERIKAQEMIEWGSINVTNADNIQYPEGAVWYLLLGIQQVIIQQGAPSPNKCLLARAERRFDETYSLASNIDRIALLTVGLGTNSLPYDVDTLSGCCPIVPPRHFKCAGIVDAATACLIHNAKVMTQMIVRKIIQLGLASYLEHATGIQQFELRSTKENEKLMEIFGQVDTAEIRLDSPVDTVMQLEAEVRKITHIPSPG
jgi:hypothetical protein